RPEPAKVTAEPPRPPRSAEAARPEPVKPTAEPAKASPRAAALVEAKKPEVKKPEPRKPDKPAKHLAAPERVARAPARAQPVDPYAAAPVAGPERPPSDPAAAYRTGLQQYARGDTAGALSTFRTSLAVAPSFAPTWRGLGLVYEKLGNKVQARLAFKRYLQLAPNAGDADQVRDRLERLGS
ncbi:MAG: tetratricopeptide repeat protein, partial [Deltaproteobacteria bacterium]